MNASARPRVSRVAAVWIAMLAMSSVQALQPAHASTTNTTLLLVTKPFSAPQGYMGGLVADRDMSSSGVHARFELFKTATGTTSAGQGEQALESRTFFFDWTRGLSARPLLGRGHVDSHAEMGAFGGVAMTITGVGRRRTRSVCSGVTVTSRPVVLDGTFSFSPDSPGQSFFGTIAETRLTGSLLRVVDTTGGHGCPSPSSQPCPTGSILGYLNQSTLFTFVGGDVTVNGTTSFIFASVQFEAPRAPELGAIDLLVVQTPDTTGFTSQSDLSAAHLDTNQLNIGSWVSGVTDYTSNGSPPTTTTQTCGSVSLLREETKGNLSAPLTVTFDGYGQVMNNPATDPADSATLDNISAGPTPVVAQAPRSRMMEVLGLELATAGWPARAATLALLRGVS